MSASDEDYATPQRLAIYLEIGWSDYLFAAPVADGARDGLLYPNPVRDVVPPRFPLAVAKLARSWARGLGLDVRSFCDVGGATGRALFEVDRQFPGLERLVLVEPSGVFCEWARRLLSSNGTLPEVPLVDRADRPKWLTPRTRPQPIPHATERLTIVDETVERYRPHHGFDLVTCLNVVDRHPCPAALVDSLGRLTNDGGLLILSCPFDFDQRSTPDVGAWIDDLDAFFAGTDSWRHVGEDELFYEYRSHARSWTRFSAQVVGKRRHGERPGAAMR